MTYDFRILKIVKENINQIFIRCHLTAVEIMSTNQKKKYEKNVNYDK